MVGHSKWTSLHLGLQKPSFPLTTGWLQIDWTVHQEVEAPVTKFIHGCIVTARDGKKHNLCDLVQRDVIDAESPLEVKNMINRLLMRFWIQWSFGNPRATNYMVDMFHMKESAEVLFHYLWLSWAIISCPARHGLSVTCVNFAFISNNGESYPSRVKNAPVLFIIPIIFCAVSGDMWPVLRCSLK